MGNQTPCCDNQRISSQNITTLSPIHAKKPQVHTSQTTHVLDSKICTILQQPYPGPESSVESEQKEQHNDQAQTNEVKADETTLNVVSFQHAKNQVSGFKQKEKSSSNSPKHEEVKNIREHEHLSYLSPIKSTQENPQDFKQINDLTQNSYILFQQKRKALKKSEDQSPQSIDSNSEELTPNYLSALQKSQSDENKKIKQIQQNKKKEQERSEAADEKSSLILPNLQHKIEQIQLPQESIELLKSDYQKILQKLRDFEDQINKQQQNPTLSNILKRSSVLKKKIKRPLHKSIFSGDYIQQQRDCSVSTSTRASTGRRDKKKEEMVQNRSFIFNQAIQQSITPNVSILQEDPIESKNKPYQKMVFSKRKKKEKESKCNQMPQVKQQIKVKNKHLLFKDFSTPHVTVNLGYSQMKVQRQKLQAESEQRRQQQDLKRVSDHRNLLSSPVELEAKNKIRSSSQQIQKGMHQKE